MDNHIEVAGIDIMRALVHDLNSYLLYKFDINQVKIAFALEVYDDTGYAGGAIGGNLEANECVNFLINALKSAGIVTVVKPLHNGKSSDA